MLCTDAQAQAARLALVESAVLALLRAANEDGFDGLLITAMDTDDLAVIDVTYTQGGVPMSGHSL